MTYWTNSTVPAVVFTNNKNWQNTLEQFSCRRRVSEIQILWTKSVLWPQNAKEKHRGHWGWYTYCCGGFWAARHRTNALIHVSKRGL